MLRKTLVAVAVSTALCHAASAATFVPNRFDDPMPGACTPDDCSLREAVMAANATPGWDLIELQEGQYALTRTSGPEAASFDLDIGTPMSLLAVGGAVSIENATGVIAAQSRVLDVTQTVVDLTGVTLTHGDVANDDGGCLRVQMANVILDGGGIVECNGNGGGAHVSNGALMLEGAIVQGNVGSGVVLRGSTLHLDDATISANLGDVGGGVRVVQGGATALSQITAEGHSSIHDNEAQTGGGVGVAGGDVEIAGPPGGFLDLSANHAVQGGGIAAGTLGGTVYAVKLYNLHVHGNSADGQGGGIHSVAIQAKRLAVSNNSATHGGGLFVNCNGALVFPCRVEESSFAFNQAKDEGGGVGTSTVGVLHLWNVASHNNRAATGGGFAVANHATLQHVTSYEDVARKGNAVAVVAGTGTALLRNSALLGGCHAVAGGMLTSEGGNVQLVGGTKCNLGNPADLGGVTAAQAAASYGNFGGGMNVVGLASGSTLLDAGAPAHCKPTDVRGYLRPAACDIGAFELDGVAP